MRKELDIFYKWSAESLMEFHDFFFFLAWNENNISVASYTGPIGK